MTFDWKVPIIAYSVIQLTGLSYFAVSSNTVTFLAHRLIEEEHVLSCGVNTSVEESGNI